MHTHTHIYTHRVLKKWDKRQRKEITEEIMDEEALKLMKDINPQIPEVLANPESCK